MSAVQPQRSTVAPSFGSEARCINYSPIATRRWPCGLAFEADSESLSELEGEAAAGRAVPAMAVETVRNASIGSAR